MAVPSRLRASVSTGQRPCSSPDSQWHRLFSLPGAPLPTAAAPWAVQGSALSPPCLHPVCLSSKHPCGSPSWLWGQNTEDKVQKWPRGRKASPGTLQVFFLPMGTDPCWLPSEEEVRVFARTSQRCFWMDLEAQEGGRRRGRSPRPHCLV